MKKLLLFFCIPSVVFSVDLTYGNDGIPKGKQVGSISFKSISHLKKAGRGGAFDQGTIVATVGYGFPNWGKTILKVYETEPGFSSFGFGPVHFRGEYGLSDNIGLGISVNFVSYGVSYTYQGYNSVTKLNQDYTDKIEVTSLSVMPRFNFHFAVSNQLDPYWGIGAGYKINSYKFSSTDPTAPPETMPGSIPVGFETTVGMRFYFTENIGVYAEIGLAKSLIQGGLSIKL